MCCWCNCPNQDTTAGVCQTLPTFPSQYVDLPRLRIRFFLIQFRVYHGRHLPVVAEIVGLRQLLWHPPPCCCFCPCCYCHRVCESVAQRTKAAGSSRLYSRVRSDNHRRTNCMIQRYWNRSHPASFPRFPTVKIWGTRRKKGGKGVGRRRKERFSKVPFIGFHLIAFHIPER